MAKKRLRGITEKVEGERITVRLDSSTNINELDLFNLMAEKPPRLIRLTVDDKEIDATLITAWYVNEKDVRLVIAPRSATALRRTKVVKAAPVVGTPSLDRFRRGWQ